MTVGQEFHAFAASLESEIALLKDAEKYLYEVNMGGTAIGTGLNAPKAFPAKCAEHLAKITGKPIVPAKDMIAATWDQQGFVVYSAALRSVAIKFSKIAGDLTAFQSATVCNTFGVHVKIMYTFIGPPCRMVYISERINGFSRVDCTRCIQHL